MIDTVDPFRAPDNRTGINTSIAQLFLECGSLWTFFRYNLIFVWIHYLWTCLSFFFTSLSWPVWHRQVRMAPSNTIMPRQVSSDTVRTARHPQARHAPADPSSTVKPVRYPQTPLRPPGTAMLVMLRQTRQAPASPSDTARLCQTPANRSVRLCQAPSGSSGSSGPSGGLTAPDTARPVRYRLTPLGPSGSVGQRQALTGPSGSVGHRQARPAPLGPSDVLRAPIVMLRQARQTPSEPSGQSISSVRLY